jgi:hypothetical protein
LIEGVRLNADGSVVIQDNSNTRKQDAKRELEANRKKEAPIKRKEQPIDGINI